MKNLKKFTTHWEYEIYINSDSAIKPNVSICADQPGHVHYNPTDRYEFFIASLSNKISSFGGNIEAIVVSTKNYENIGYTYVCDAEWASFANNVFTFDNNFDDTRTCTFTFTQNESGDVKTVTFTQEELLCFTAELANSSVTLQKNGNPTNVSLMISINGGSWTPYTIGSTITLANVGDKVYISNTSGTPTGFSSSETDYYHVAMTGLIAASGSIDSFRCKDVTKVTNEVNYCYISMFANCTSLTTAPKLPATILADYCYAAMFKGCSNLTIAPELPATTLTEGCYNTMFYGCSNLTTAPELPATILATGCYLSMFYGCTNLTTAPALPATTLTTRCYGQMFLNCTSLTTAPELPATTLADQCYTNMFQDCSSLTTAPELPATTLTYRCYLQMFLNCTSLTTAPELPATTLTEGCYGIMFQNCSSLTTAPELPATTLATDCYRNMFYGCTNLTTAPALPATTLTTRCYLSMFYGCSNVNRITCLATNSYGNESEFMSDWLSNVANSGTFAKKRGTQWSTSSASGIPTGWSVIEVD